MAAGQDDVFARSGHGGFMCGVDMEAVPCAHADMERYMCIWIVYLEPCQPFQNRYFNGTAR